jgi:hypothetical protein
MRGTGRAAWPVLKFIVSALPSPRPLLDRLREVFPSGPSPESLVSPLAREAAREGAEKMAASLAGRQWTDVTQEEAEALAPHLLTLSVEAFVYYLPAFISSALHDPDGESGTYVLYALVPLGALESFYQGTCRLFTQDQAALIVAILERFQQEPSFVFFSEEIPTGLSLWGQRAAEVG